MKWVGLFYYYILLCLCSIALALRGGIVDGLCVNEGGRIVEYTGRLLGKLYEF